MSKYSKGDTVRVTDPTHEKFDQVGVVDSVFRDSRHWAYSVQFGNLYMPIAEHHLILALQPVADLLDQMDAESKFVSVGSESNPITIRLTDPERPGFKDITEQEIDGDYVRGGSVDHAATLKTMAQGLAAEMDAAQNAHREAVTHPSHYTSHPSGIECIQITEHMGFNLGNALKYVWRCDLKTDAIEDLEKARWYIERELAKRKAAQ